jgi:D-sedoheptulose 7-phosphate isomerase
MKTIDLHGRGALTKICSMSIVVPSQTTARIQEAHIFIGHALCGLVEEHLGFA